MREVLDRHDLLFSVGGDMFTWSLPSKIKPMPPGMPLIHLDTDPWQIGKSYPAQVGILGDPKATLPDITAAVRERMSAGAKTAAAARLKSAPDFGPARPHPTAGAVLAAARPPLVAFNVDLVTDDLAVAKRIAAELRESGGGLPGVRALGLYLHDRNRAQVSTNVHDHSAVPLRRIVEFVRERAEVAEAELIGLAPRAAFEGFPEDVPIRGFDPERHLLEEALRAVA